MRLPSFLQFPRHPCAPSSRPNSSSLYKCSSSSISSYIYDSHFPSFNLANNMATGSTYLSKPSKWFSGNTFRPTLHRRRRSKPCSSPTSPTSPHNSSTSRQAEDFREAFHRFDGNGDGKISSDELRSFFASAGEEMTLEEAERAIRGLDSDGDGLMDYGDFARLMESDGDGGHEDLRRAFEMFEVEKGSGCITPKGLQRVLSRLGDVRSHEECAAMIRAYDIDGNGVLDYHEFHSMMTW